MSNANFEPAPHASSEDEGYNPRSQASRDDFHARAAAKHGIHAWATPNTIVVSPWTSEHMPYDEYVVHTQHYGGKMAVDRALGRAESEMLLEPTLEFNDVLAAA
jgi:hypothetical protein